MNPSPRESAKNIVTRLQAAGFTAFWVGGCVRDFLLGCDPQDFDIATDAKPEQVEQLFPKTIPVGRKFGVVIVVEPEHQFQVATFRAEADYQDGRRPEKVQFAHAEADAARRDFTVNGLFYDPLTEKIHDWVGGEKDLRARIIRTIGPPEERFSEDHLRMLRAVRFAARLGFEIEPGTFAAIQKLAPKIKGISAERIRDELVKLFAPPSAGFSLSPPKRGEGRGEDLPNSDPPIESPNQEAPPLPACGHPLLHSEWRRGTGREGDPVLGEAAVSGEINFPSPQPSPRLGGEREKNGGADLLVSQAAAQQRRPTIPAARGLVLLHESGLLEQVLPELAATVHCEQSPDFHPEGSVFNHLRLMLEHLPADAPELLPWAVLLHDIAKPATAERDAATGRIHFYGHEKVGAEMAEQILRRLKFPNEPIATVAAAVQHHMQFKDVKQMRKATLRRMLLRPTFPLELALHRLDCLGSNGDLAHHDFCVAAAEELQRAPEIHPPLLTGDDLLALGIPPGKRIGELLHQLRDLQLAEAIKTPDEARAWVKASLLPKAG